MIRTNKDKLPIVLVEGKVKHSMAKPGGRLSPDGEALWLQGTGGVTFNAQIGDCCMGWVADHLEPGVSTRNPDDKLNEAYNCFSCIGNQAIVKSGDAKGARGFVIGKHGGCEHLMVHFDPETLENLSIEDKIGVKATGQGMALLDYPDILLRSMSPVLLEKMNITEKDGLLEIGVAKIIPAAIMGSGLGAANSTTGDYDITLHDPEYYKEYADLRFGDLVAITDADTRFGRTFRRGAVTIGVVIHGDSNLAGHGPGVTTLMSCSAPLIRPVLDSNANLKNFFVE